MFTVQTTIFNKPKSNLFFRLDGFGEGNVNWQLAIGGWQPGGRSELPVPGSKMSAVGIFLVPTTISEPYFLYFWRNLILRNNIE